MQFRLGWSRIRAKKDVDRGITNLEEAARLIPDNVEILLKLAGAIFQEQTETPDHNQKILDAVDRII